MRVACLLALLTFCAAGASAGESLLIDGDFQEDWLTLLPELKNHHWNYTTEVFGRRDYNPDGWRLSGNWEWRDADRPSGERKFVMKPGSKAIQTVNWITIHDPMKLEGWPDAGGYPAAQGVRSKSPEKLLTNLALKVRYSGTNLPANGVTARVGFSTGAPVDDPEAKRRIGFVASLALAPGDHSSAIAELKLPAAAWLAALAELPEAAKKEMVNAEGTLLPLSAFVEFDFAANSAGEAEIHSVQLFDDSPRPPSPFAFGDFEEVGDKGLVAGWLKPEKYRYFPPGIYYIFNTWHNSNSENRGIVRRDTLVAHSGRGSFQMIVPAGDEVAIRSEAISLNQTAPGLIEVTAHVKTEQLAMLQIDAEDEQGNRLPGYNFIHKNPQPIGTSPWRQVRQVFRPSTPVKSLRVKLCARGANGYTLDDTGLQPQQNACGMIWWDDVQVRELEPATPPKRMDRSTRAPAPHLAQLHLGERLIGRNLLTATIFHPGPKAAKFRLEFQLAPPGGDISVVRGDLVDVPAVGTRDVKLPYDIAMPMREPYTEYRGQLRLLDESGKTVSAAPIWLTTWNTPCDIELGALYLRPEQTKQFIRLNLGLASSEMGALQEVRLELVRRGTGNVLQTSSIPATPADIAAQRKRIPDGLRDDFRNLLLADLEVGALPLQAWLSPQRSFYVRVTAVFHGGNTRALGQSPPFCRLDHAPQQPEVKSVALNEAGDVLVNGQPWMPWGVTYGHNPVYDGPAAGPEVKFHDLANFKQWSLYDRHGGTLGKRELWDVNCLRFVEGAPTPPDKLPEMMKSGLYASTVFVKPPAAGKPWPEEYLAKIKAAPNLVAVSPGPEEAFGHFAPMTSEQLAKVKAQADYLRKATGRPVMVGHGGYWTRLELERVPFFDILDPETEPLYPAPLHTDLAPLIAGQPKAIWLRPQMYESVPYERWRYHVYVELIRGARGWQIAHGPGDASTMRGLHAELESLRPAIYSKDAAPNVTITPPLEYLVRRHGGETYLVVASTHGMSFGNWRFVGSNQGPDGTRESVDPHIFRDESDGYHATGEPPHRALVPHGIQNLIHPRAWPAGTKLVTSVKLDSTTPPKNLIALVKADGRWTRAGVWGNWDPSVVRNDNDAAFWFLRTFYRHARGFLGWGDKVAPYALAYLPSEAKTLGNLPKAGEWLELELPLISIGADGKLVDGVAFMHEGGRVLWANTRLLDPEGKEQMIFGRYEDRASPEALQATRIEVAGLKAGTKVQVLFEDRELIAQDGFFTDDFRGEDLYQRYGGERSGYGNSPVAAHIYRVGAK